MQVAGGTYQPREARTTRRYSRSRSRSSYSGEWRRSPSPLRRRPPTPPPPPPRRAHPAARGEGAPHPEPPARRFHRGTRAGDLVRMRRARAAERASPFTAASASTNPFSSSVRHRPFWQRTWPISFPRRLRANCSRAGARCFCKPGGPFACPPGVVVALLSPAGPSDFASLAAVLAPSRKQLRAGSR